MSKDINVHIRALLYANAYIYVQIMLLSLHIGLIMYKFYLLLQGILIDGLYGNGLIRLVLCLIRTVCYDYEVYAASLSKRPPRPHYYRFSLWLCQSVILCYSCYYVIHSTAYALASGATMLYKVLVYTYLTNSLLTVNRIYRYLVD